MSGVINKSHEYKQMVHSENNTGGICLGAARFADRGIASHNKCHPVTISFRTFF